MSDKPMRLYLLTTKEGHYASFDEYDGFVISARSPREARRLAAEKAKGMNAETWADPEKSRVQVLTPAETPCIHLSDFVSG